MEIGMEAVYERLQYDLNDAVAWQRLEARVTVWANRDLRARGEHLVQDAVADTCANAVVNLQRARSAETFEGFVLGHYLNVRRRILRELQRSTVPLGNIDLPDSCDPDPRPSERDLELLHHCLSELPRRERRAVELRFFEDASQDTISVELGVTVVNARRIVFNGLTRLRRCARQRPWGLGEARPTIEA